LVERDEPYRISLEEQSLDADVKVVWDGLMAFNDEHAGEDNHRDLRVFLRDQDGKVVGGLLGDTFWNWLNVHILWPQEPARLQGWGSRLLAEAEQEAIRRGCAWAMLDTLSFQARPFYEKHGYSVYAELADFPPPHSRYFMKKRLA
jgi:GNAT superfamily N-acetyltransferase